MPKPKLPIRVDLSKIRILSDDEKLRLLTSPRHNERAPKTTEQKIKQSQVVRGKIPWNKGMQVIIPKHLRRTVGFRSSSKFLSDLPLPFMVVKGLKA